MDIYAENCDPLYWNRCVQNDRFNIEEDAQKVRDAREKLARAKLENNKITESFIPASVIAGAGTSLLPGTDESRNPRSGADDVVLVLTITRTTLRIMMFFILIVVFAMMFGGPSPQPNIYITVPKTTG